MLSNIAAETGLLSCLMNAPVTMATDILETSREDHFSTHAHKVIFRLCCKLVGKKHEPELLSVIAEAESANVLDEIGGAVKLTEIATHCASHTGWKAHLDILEELRFRRAGQEFANQFSAKAEDMNMSVEELKDWSEKEVLRLDYMNGNAATESTKTALLEAANNIESMYNQDGPMGLPVGLQSMDRILDGLKPAEMSIVAARPSTGKSAFGFQVGSFLAVEEKKRVLVFSLEMSSASLLQRMMFTRSGVEPSKFRDKQATKGDFEAIRRAMTEIGGSDLIIDDESSLSIAQVKARARRHHKVRPVDIIIIDYLQLLRGVSKRGKENRVQEVAEISHGLKDLSKMLKCHVMVLAQLNRGPENRKDQKPRMSDLRESGDVEQDADVVILLSRKQEDEEEEKADRSGVVMFDVAKHRNGQTGMTQLYFKAPITKFIPNY